MSVAGVQLTAEQRMCCFVTLEHPQSYTDAGHEVDHIIGEKHRGLHGSVTSPLIPTG